MKKNLSEMIKVLEDAGIDTSKFAVTINGRDLKSFDEEFVDKISKIVGENQIENKTFRRWVLAQTMRMLYTPVWDNKKKHYVTGWEPYLRINYNYDYQFKMLLEELKTLSKMQKKRSSEFETRSKFFTKNVVIKLCEDAINKTSFYDYRVDTAKKIIHILYTSRPNDYRNMYTFLLDFINTGILNLIPKSTRKCQAWKDAYKGAGAYYSLQNMILYHNCIIRGCIDCKTSYDALNNRMSLLYKKDEIWALHIMLLDTIQFNGFILSKSIEKNK